MYLINMGIQKLKLLNHLAIEKEKSTMFKRLFCKHEYRYIRGIYGDEIILSGYKRSVWKCEKCGKFKGSESLDKLS